VPKSIDSAIFFIELLLLDHFRLPARPLFEQRIFSDYRNK